MAQTESVNKNKIHMTYHKCCEWIRFCDQWFWSITDCSVKISSRNTSTSSRSSLPTSSKSRSVLPSLGTESSAKRWAVLVTGKLEGWVTKFGESFYKQLVALRSWWINIGPVLSSCQSSQGGLYTPEKHGMIGNLGHWFIFWGQLWPPRSFGGRHGLRGPQNECQRQHTHGYQGNWGYRF